MPRSRVTERQLAAERVADHADWYREDQNPLRAWLAYRECRRHRLPVPGWVHEYFERVSEALALWASSGRRPPKDLASAILGVLAGCGKSG
jgi:hypothetical protein